MIYSQGVQQSLPSPVRVVIICESGCDHRRSGRAWTATPTTLGCFCPRAFSGPPEEGAQVLIAILELSMDTF